MASGIDQNGGGASKQELVRDTLLELVGEWSPGVGESAFNQHSSSSANAQDRELARLGHCPVSNRSLASRFQPLRPTVTSLFVLTRVSVSEGGGMV